MKRLQNVPRMKIWRLLCQRTTCMTFLMPLFAVCGLRKQMATGDLAYSRTPRTLLKLMFWSEECSWVFQGSRAKILHLYEYVQH